MVAPRPGRVRRRKVGTVLLDRRRVRFWQKWVFGAMAVLMALWLVSIPISRWVGCASSDQAVNTLDDEIATLRQRISASPDDLALRLDLAESLRRRAGQAAQDPQEREDYLRASAKAYEAYIKLLAKTKGTKAERKEAERLQIAALEDLVVVYRTLNDFDSVKRVFGQLTDLRPNNASYFYDMGRTAISAGDTNTALLAFGRYLELEPDSEEAAQIKEWMAANTSGGGNP
jgi:tetratricopeptide (TPR) repeat protein